MSSIRDNYEEFLRENSIPNELYKKNDVKKGLRNEDGTGVLVGLTTISDVVGYKMEDGKKVDDEGTLYYRGISVEDIITHGEGRRFLFEETCFLILFGHLPTQEELDQFQKYIASLYPLPERYLEMSILTFPAKNLMNKLQREILQFYSYDDNPDDTGAYDTLIKGINLLAKVPSIICYTYWAKIHAFENKSLVIHNMHKDYSIAESILHLLRVDGDFSPKEASVLDAVLVLHADHGGGNNSTFTDVVMSSTGTDLYSAIAGAVGSLKGPKHGGANLKVRSQMKAVMSDIGVDASDEEIQRVVKEILNKNYNDHSGLVYGIGHAVYTLSDPRAVILEKKAEELAALKGRTAELNFHKKFAKAAIDELYVRKGVHVCTNVDYYTGFIYDMLGIPEDLYTVLFVMGRLVGWVAHNIEEKLYSAKIIRPATLYVGDMQEYKELEER